MKTKAEIVQRLLDEKKIDAEEAVILLMGNEKDRDTIYVPYQPFYPLSPHNPPYNPNPIWYGTTCSTAKTLPDNATLNFTN